MPITPSGLPAHPRVIHLAAVAAPIAAIFCLVWVIRPRPLTHSWCIAGLATSAVAAASMLLERSTGESLLPAMGLPEENPGIVARHAELADAATVATFGLFGLAAVLYPVTSTRLVPAAPSWALPTTRILFGIAAVPSVISTIAVGHAGAQLAWQNFPNNFSAETENPRSTFMAPGFSSKKLRGPSWDRTSDLSGVNGTLFH